MRALVLTGQGPPDTLQVQERPEPEPALGQVRVAVHAAGVNFADLLARLGLYPDAPPVPAVLGYEVAGEVDALGEGVEGVRRGDRVMAACRFGGYAERAVCDARNVLPLPAGWSFEDGAAFPVNYGTAYAGLVRFGALARDERVLVHAAAGGVGIAATQIAKRLGATVFGTASAHKHEALRELGVDHPVDYRTRDFVAEVRRLTGERRPLDVAMDPVGGRSFSRSFSLLAPGGRLVCFGASAVAERPGGSTLARRARAARALLATPRFNPLSLMAGSRAVIGLNLLRLLDRGSAFEHAVAELTAWIEEGAIRPVVARAVPLEQGAEAHRMLEERVNVGKVVLTM